MTCQCTCGKHMLVDISKSVMFPAQGAAGAAAYPVTVFHGNTAAFQGSLVDLRPHTAAGDGCSPAMPPHWHVAT